MVLESFFYSCSFRNCSDNFAILSYCYITVDNNNQNGYVPAPLCNQFVLKETLCTGIYTHWAFQCGFALIYPNGSINKNLSYSHLRVSLYLQFVRFVTQSTCHFRGSGDTSLGKTCAAHMVADLAKVAMGHNRKVPWTLGSSSPCEGPGHLEHHKGRPAVPSQLPTLGWLG